MASLVYFLNGCLGKREIENWKLLLDLFAYLFVCMHMSACVCHGICIKIRCYLLLPCGSWGSTWVIGPVWQWESLKWIQWLLLCVPLGKVVYLVIQTLIQVLVWVCNCLGRLSAHFEQRWKCSYLFSSKILDINRKSINGGRAFLLNQLPDFK